MSTRPRFLVSVRARSALNYESTVLLMRDGLPKLKDFPAEPGGSGETLAE